MGKEKIRSESKLKIPYFKPPFLEKRSVISKIEEIIDTRIYTKGIYHFELEKQLADYLNVDYAITCSSGTMAIFIALRTLKELEGYNTVAMPSFNWSSDRIAAEMANYEIIYADINPDTWLMDNVPGAVDLVMPVDTFGSRSDLHLEYSVPMMFDATHSLGCEGVGDRGLLECISFAATKTVTAGEGGLITTNYPDIAKKATELRDMCSRLPEISCVMASAYLRTLDERIKAKKRINWYYRKHLPYQFQKIESDSTFSKVCFLCETKEESEEIIKKTTGIVECRKYYKPLVKSLKNTDDIYNRIVCIPAWVGCPTERVVEAIKT